MDMLSFINVFKLQIIRIYEKWECVCVCVKIQNANASIQYDRVDGDLC